MPSEADIYHNEELLQFIVKLEAIEAIEAVQVVYYPMRIVCGKTSRTVLFQ
jgi:hypothetical protein